MRSVRDDRVGERVKVDKPSGDEGQKRLKVIDKETETNNQNSAVLIMCYIPHKSYRQTYLVLILRVVCIVD